MKIATFGYIPPASFPGAQAFYENIMAFKHTHPLMLFSDAEWPDTFRLKMSPEVPFAQGRPHKFVINNTLWFTALKIARDQGYSQMLFLESDCRVLGDHWDDKIFTEYFEMGRPLVAGGTLATYNPASWSLKAMQRWERLVVENAEKWQEKPYAKCQLNLPVATYGWKPMKGEGVSGSERSPCCVFPNGALGIYNISWMHELFDLTQTAVALAISPFPEGRPGPYDMALGVKVWNRFEEDAYEVLGHLTSIYSGFGDVITSPEDRRALLTSGKVVGIHQIKDSWKP